MRAAVDFTPSANASTPEDRYDGWTRDRAHPRLWDTDWLMLRGMARALDRLIGRHVKSGGTVIDFGCGDMPYRALVERRGGVYIGADFGNEAMICITPDGRLPVPDESAEMVISVQVLEHVADLDTYFSEISRVLKKDGVLLLSTHGTWLYHPHPGDYRRWTRAGLVHDIEARAFDVQEVEAIVGPLGTTTMIRLTGFAFFLRRIPIVGSPITGLIAMAMNVRGWLEEKLTPDQIRDDNGCVYVTRCDRAIR